MKRLKTPPAGLVTACYGRKADVLYQGRMVKALLKGRLWQNAAENAVVAGDYCLLQRQKNIYLIQKRLERDNELKRFVETRNGTVPQVIAANCDQIMAVFSFIAPNINLLYLDTILCLAMYEHITPYIVFNKTDLVDMHDFSDLVTTYRDAGFDVLLTSAKEGSNLPAVKALMQGGKTVLIGPSGAGKSLLLRQVFPDCEDVKVGDLTRQGRGRHTTTTTRIHQVADDTFIFDTPGFGKLLHRHLPADVIACGYPDLAARTGGCHFSNCRHIEETACGVKQALLERQLSAQRYRRYFILSRIDDPLGENVRFRILEDSGLFVLPTRVFLELNVDRAKELQREVASFKRVNWFHYAPFAYFMGLTNKRRLLCHTMAGKTQLLLWRFNETGESLSVFYLHPYLSTQEVEEVVSLVREVNVSSRCDIMFLARQDLARLPAGARLDMTGREHVYSRQEVVELAGGRFRDLRKKIARSKRQHPGLHFRSFKTGDGDAMVQIYHRWLAQQSATYPELYDVYYTEHALKRITDMLRLDMRAVVAEDRGKVKGFLLGGRINSATSCAFILKYDMAVYGLSYRLKYEFCRLCDTSYVNDGVDFAFSGLQRSKRKFRAHGMPAVYRATVG